MANIVKSSSLGEMFDEDRTKMTKKRRDMIHKHRKWADVYGPELPVQIGNNRKLPRLPRSYGIACESCGHEMAVSKITYIVICSKCGNLCKIEGDE
jgi:hypothetical protein